MCAATLCHRELETGLIGTNPSNLLNSPVILPIPAKFDALCDDLHRQDLVAREHRVAPGEAPGEEITFDVCVRTPHVFEFSNGSLELMTAAESSLLLSGNPSLQIEVPQGTAPVIQLDVGHSPFETIFPQGS